jgi:PleD family two-component response regulator
VTISAGIALHTGPGAPDPDALLHQADAALYQAKGAGRNCVLLGADAA